MRYAFGSQARSRWIALFLLGAVLLSCMLFLQDALDPEKSKVPGFDISGEWEFYNGEIRDDPALKIFPKRVIVPNPLPAEITKNLASEFWYRTRFVVPPGLRRDGVLLYLGSIKGEHEVYWQGKFLGAGGTTSLGMYRIPESFLTDKTVTLLVKVKKTATIYPGIVNMSRVVIGDAGAGPDVFNQYYFETGVRPLLPTVLKFALFFIFIGFFIAVPYKREYLSFSLFALLSGLSSAFYSKFFPGYDHYYFRNSLIFCFFVISMGIVPMMAVDMLRLPERFRSSGRVAGFSLSLIFLLAALFTHDRKHLLNVFRIANAWLPAVCLLSSAILSVFFAFKLDKSLVHRKFQILAFSFFLLLGVFAFGSGISSFMTFELFQFRTFFDLVVSAGLGISLALDFKLTDVRSRQAAKAIPKWFSGFLSRGLDHVTLELPLVVLAVDTVGYTKRLTGLNDREKDALHAAIRSRLADLTEVAGAQKISERGDGGIFAWDFPDSEGRREILRKVLDAAKRLNEAPHGDLSIAFRVGISSGLVRGELRGGDISFLGEALNIASRLETMAEPGTALVDALLASEFSEAELGPESIVAELKGVTYRARPIRRAA